VLRSTLLGSSALGRYAPPYLIHESQLISLSVFHLFIVPRRGLILIEAGNLLRFASHSSLSGKFPNFLFIVNLAYFEFLCVCFQATCNEINATRDIFNISIRLRHLLNAFYVAQTVHISCFCKLQ
jgi:membrane-anchored glycerophosphoryl diester phosphodiesterase (GDPDase)